MLGGCLARKPVSRNTHRELYEGTVVHQTYISSPAAITLLHGELCPLGLFKGQCFRSAAGGGMVGNKRKYRIVCNIWVWETFGKQTGNNLIVCSHLTSI